MIQFVRNEKILRVKINDQITNTDWLFDFNLSSESRAEICKRHFKSEFENRIKEIRRKAYEEGYKTGKNKQKKLKEFNPWIDTDRIGWY